MVNERVNLHFFDLANHPVRRIAPSLATFVDPLGWHQPVGAHRPLVVQPVRRLTDEQIALVQRYLEPKFWEAKLA